MRPETEDVRQLDYQHNMLQDVPPQVFAYERTLEELYLDSNRIRDLPRPLFHCHGLRVLSMSDNDVQSLPPAIASLINLQHLDLSRNELCGIPDNIKGCKHLVYVDVSVNQLEKLPEGFTQLLSLEELYLNDTCLDFLPANFGRLTKLRILELRENNLNTLPKSIARLTSLERMDIGQNEFSDLPEVIGRLVNLAELWVDCNRVRSIPKFIGNLKKLVHLDASTNNINWIAPEIGSCCCLTDLTLSCNEIQEIPETIGNLKQLVTLKLDDNQLTTVPKTFGKLSNLEELILSQNDFEILPPCIGLLRKLNILNIDDNSLEELPPEIGSCISLTILSVRSNKLQEVPAELGHLPNIRVVNLSDNQLRNLPVSILNLTCLTALWLSNNQSTPLTTLQQEVDKVTGQTVCVNFMLPQSTQELSLAGNWSEEKADVRCSPKRLERPHIHFAADAESEVTGHLVRAPTPYPKELRAMAKHARSFQQQHTRRASRESDVDVPLLGEIVSSGPKGVLIKEAKVKKPSIVPLVHPEEPRQDKGNEDASGQSVDNSGIVSRYENADTCTSETSPVFASGSGPIIREAKCVRQVTNMAEERQKFFSQREEFPPIPVPLENSSTSQKSPLALQRTVIDSPRPSINTDQQQPPPYHIAAVYSKQAAYFQNRTVSPAAIMSPAVPADTPVFLERRISDHKEPFSSAPVPVVQVKSVTEETDGRESSGQTSEGSHTNYPEEKSVIKKVDAVKIIGHLEQHEKSEENVDVSIPADERLSGKETGKGSVTEIAVQDTLVDECEQHKSRGSSLEESSHEIERKAIVLSAFINTTSTTMPSAPTITSVCTSKTVTNTVTVTSPAAVSNADNITTITTSPIASVSGTITIEDSVRQTERRVSDTRQDKSNPIAEVSQLHDVRNASLSPKCRIPVRLGEPVSLKSSVPVVDDLLNTPSTFTQDKPTVGDSVCAPTPQRPGCNSPNSLTPLSSKAVASKSPTSVSRAGTKIPTLLPTASHGLGKEDNKSPQNSSLTALSEKMVFPDAKALPASTSLNHEKSDVFSSSVLSSSRSSSVSNADSLSESPSGTRIPQPGFYFSSSVNLQSSKRASLSSQSSSSSRPGSIAPLLNTSLDFPTSPIDKEAAYNYINKPNFSTTDHNLNISSKIPTAVSPSSLSLNPVSGFSNLDESALHGTPKSTSNEHSPLVSKIPTLTFTPTSPLGSPSQRLLSDGSQRMSVESPGKHTKSWMFGPHKNATVFPVVIKKNPGLGFSITGGLWSASPLEKRDSVGIFVTKVHPNGPASGCLQPGDKILEVDGTDFTKVEHDQAVGILKQTGSTVNMMISRQQ